MDVYGNSPLNDSGAYFRANVWYWRPLWDMIENLYPDIAAKVPYAHYNDGDGLNSTDSIILSNLLKAHIDSGFIAEYIQQYEESLESLPDEDCNYCNKTGYRLWTNEDGSAYQKQCNVCSGTLKFPNINKSYRMHIDLVKEFQTFLANCGGFKIF